MDLFLEFVKENLDADAKFNPVEGLFEINLTTEELAEKMNKLVELDNVNRQCPDSWFPVTLEEAIEDFDEPEMEGSYYIDVEVSDGDDDVIGYAVNITTNAVYTS